MCKNRTWTVLGQGAEDQMDWLNDWSWKGTLHIALFVARPPCNLLTHLLCEINNPGAFACLTQEPPTKYMAE